jgi:hypothetical protein
MSVKVTGSDERLSLRLPSEGQTWVRHGNEMVGAAAGGGGGGGGGAADEFVQGSNDVTPTVPHSDCELDAIDPFFQALPAGTTDGFVKTLRANGSGGGPGTSITGAFRIGAGVGTQPTQINLTANGDGALLVWQAATARWVIRLLVGGATATAGPP